MIILDMMKMLMALTEMAKDHHLQVDQELHHVDLRVLQSLGVDHRIKMMIVRQIVQNHHRPHQVLVEREIKLMMNCWKVTRLCLLLEERIVREVEVQLEFQGAATRRRLKRVQQTLEVAVAHHEVQVRNQPRLSEIAIVHWTRIQVMMALMTSTQMVRYCHYHLVDVLAVLMIVPHLVRKLRRHLSQVESPPLLTLMMTHKNLCLLLEQRIADWEFLRVASIPINEECLVDSRVIDPHQVRNLLLPLVATPTRIQMVHWTTT
jgi:hypothetical protein